MKQNYLNVKFASYLLEEITRAIKVQEPVLKAIKVSQWGCHDDFIYSEVLQECFKELLPCERKALMRIVREVINASAIAYAELLEDNYLCYENLDQYKGDLDEFIDNLEDNSKEY
jgi:hypothetical protein